jgi:hypothetical protein
MQKTAMEVETTPRISPRTPEMIPILNGRLTARSADRLTSEPALSLLKLSEFDKNSELSKYDEPGKEPLTYILDEGAHTEEAF